MSCNVGLSAEFFSVGVDENSRLSKTDGSRPPSSKLIKNIMKIDLLLFHIKL